jgi:predicted dehydrogenase
MSDSNNMLRAKRRSRREFLHSSARTLSGAAAATLLISRSAHAAGDDTIKVGLIGCGSRGSGAANQAILADRGVRLVALADIFEDRVNVSRDLLKRAHPDQVTVDDGHCFVGFDAYQKVINSGVDVVLIACASRFHPSYVKACVEAGKHVFVEKPQAIDPPGVRMMLDATEEAEKKKLNLVAGLHLRYDPGIRETMARVFDGAIGRIVAIEANFMRNPYRIIERRPEWSEIEWQYRNWYHFRWLSGDDVVQSLVHTIDLGAWAMNEEPPVCAHALGGRSSCFGVQYGDGLDHAAVVYEYGNGVRMYGFNRTQYGCHASFSAKLLGSKGFCDVMGQRISGDTNWRYGGPRRDGHQVEQEELLSAIRSGNVINNGLYMTRSTMLAVLGQMAVYTSKQITWRDALNSDFSYEPQQCDFSTQPPVKPDEKGIYPVPIPGITKLI